MGATSLPVAGPATRARSKPLSPAKPDTLRCGSCDLAREADHRIANHLAMLSGYVGLRQAELRQAGPNATSVPVQLAFDGIKTLIDAISRLHRALLTSTHGAEVDLCEFIRHICAPLQSGLSGKIKLTADLQTGCRVRSDQILPLTQIISEVITNAVKYSHVADEAGSVSVSCRRAANNELELEIVDDGMGLPQNLEPRMATGLGFRLIRALAAQIGARSGFESSPAGTRFWLRLERAPDDGAGALGPGPREVAGVCPTNSEG